MNVDWEVIGSLALLAFFVFVIWRSGSANPVGTGQLQKQMNTLGGKVGMLEASVKDCATTAELNLLSAALKDMEGRVASSGEILALEAKIGVISSKIGGVEARLTEQIAGVNDLVSAKISGVVKLTDRTDATVSRIEDYLRGGAK